jgi:dTDP-4-dehydrorhamnose reductase
MVNPSLQLFTGGSGLLGRALQQARPGALYPTSTEFDVSRYSQMREWIGGREIRVIVHAAAMTSPPKVDQDPLRALDANIIGTANVVRLAAEMGSRLVYISTDYVFRGDRGGYREADELYPVNKYAWSKLGGECAVRLYESALIIRTSFGPDVFPYEKAFVDQWTSRQPVSRTAREILRAVDSNLTGVLHIGGARQTVMEYARSLDPSKEIKPLSVNDVSFVVPRDTSLESTRAAEGTGE